MNYVSNDTTTAAAIWENRDVDIEHTGTKITLPGEPGPMPLRTAIAALERKALDEETELDVTEVLDAYPEDALVAFNAAMRQKYGWASPTPVMSFFGPIAPDLVTVLTGPKPGQAVQVPMGQFTLPGVENPIMVRRSKLRGQPVLVVSGTVRKREAQVVKDLAELARSILKERSIYKGQAIRLKVNDEGVLETDTPPQFIDTTSIRPNELVLNPVELEQVEATLWAPIQNTEACVKHGIPLNRGVLLEGIYGTGKTMTAHVTSKVCVDNQWTYILLDDVRALKDALLFARRYQPAVVFAEDVDRVVAVRDQRGNDLLNTIDGVLTKDSQVITVLTTNHVEVLDRAMLRPGRLDAVISVRAPEAEAVGRLLRLYGRGLIGEAETLYEVSEYLAGNIPATIREVVERSKLSMIAHGREVVTEHDLLVAARGMEHHLQLLRDTPPQKSVEEQAGAAIGMLVAAHAKHDVSDELQEGVEALQRSVNDVNGAAGAIVVTTMEASNRVDKALKPIAKQVNEIHRETV
jgi:SpoVK/Ycf46/Vps4 family AAA+-type ATPase